MFKRYILLTSIFSLLTGFVFTSQPKAIETTPGLVASYGFNNSQDPYLDLSLNNLTLTCGTNCPAYVQDGGRGNSGVFDFNGNTNYVVVPSEQMFDFTNQMSVTFWMKNNLFDNVWEAMVAKGGFLLEC